jgi:hypothetical protein
LRWVAAEDAVPCRGNVWLLTDIINAPTKEDTNVALLPKPVLETVVGLANGSNFA